MLCSSHSSTVLQAYSPGLLCSLSWVIWLTYRGAPQHKWPLKVRDDSPQYFTFYVTVFNWLSKVVRVASVLACYAFWLVYKTSGHSVLNPEWGAKSKPIANSGLQRYRDLAISGVQTPLKTWIFFRLLYAIAYNCVHNCEDQSSFDFSNCEFLAHIFPRLPPTACFCFEFWLVHYAVCVCSDWPKWC